MVTAIRWWGLAFLGLPMIATAAPAQETERALREVAEMVLPAGGYQSRVALGDSIVMLAHAGVLDPKKFATVFARRGGMPTGLENVLDKPSPRPILLTRANAGVYVNLLWALGLANRMAVNDASPLKGPSLSRFASTGGWTLGRKENGGDYFNRFPIVALTARQEALVARITRHTFRPCCNNSTFFQDCNHGSALLGLLALGASQGLGEQELYREALAFNAFWFPQNYAHTALYFKNARGIGWHDVDAQAVMGADFSSASGWRKNVARALEARGLLPAQGGTDCDV